MKTVNENNNAKEISLWPASIDALESATPETVANFKRHLLEEGYAKSTVRSRIPISSTALPPRGQPSMRPEVQSLLYDMQEACRLIHRFTEGKQFDDYAGDLACQSAVERQSVRLSSWLWVWPQRSPAM